MRVKGLVRACNTIRNQMHSGVRADEILQLKMQVESLFQAVEQMCAQRGLTPDQLPRPSRNAYRFLKQLDLDDLPLQVAVIPSKPAVPPAINNLVKLGGHIADRLWLESQAPDSWSSERSTLLTNIQREVSQVERICLEKDSIPSALAPPSKRVYCWLKFLSTRDRINLHLAALQRMASTLPNSRGGAERPVRIHMVNMVALWRVRQYQNAVRVRVNEGFLNAGPEVCQAIVGSCLKQETPAWNRLIRQFANSEDFSEVLFEMESFAEPTTPNAQGFVHSLDESFDRVNKVYFAGSMSKPRLVWNETLTVRKLGHYQQSLDTVMLSVTLDDAEASPHLVDFVMYHELLHKKHGTVIANGRGLAHSRQFRADEKLFSCYDEAVGALSDLARRYR